jgi:valyl-tRNA synthetase
VSSLTPKIALANAEAKGIDVSKLKGAPFDARPQAQDIIRTWAYYTIVQSLLNDNQIPWQQAWVSGFVLDPDRKKMSKSKGNVVTPADWIERYGADSIRLWAASTKLGIDATSDEKMLEQKRKLVMKMFNAAKFIFGFQGESASAATVATDAAYLAKLQAVAKQAEKYFAATDYNGAEILVEQAFWDFCDNYLEIVKVRAYAGDGSALYTLRFAMSVFCALFAPFAPFITEEIWQVMHDGRSVHSECFPSKWAEFEKDYGDAAAYEQLCAVVSDGRKVKSEAGKSMKYPFEKMVVSSALEQFADDIKNVLSVKDLSFASGDALVISSELAVEA